MMCKTFGRSVIWNGSEKMWVKLLLMGKDVSQRNVSHAWLCGRARRSNITASRSSMQSGRAVACCHANFKGSCRQMEGKCHAVPAWSQSLLPAAQSVEDVLELEGVLKPHVDFTKNIHLLRRCFSVPGMWSPMDERYKFPQGSTRYYIIIPNTPKKIMRNCNRHINKWSFLPRVLELSLRS